MARPWFLGALLGVALAVSGCASMGGGALVPPSLAGSSWIAEAVDGEGMVGRPPITLTFESAERAVGSTGCNRYFAAVRMSERARLRFGQPGSTRMACPPAVMEQEQRFLAAIEAVRGYRLDGTALVLVDERDLARLRLIRAPRGAAPARLAAYAFDCTGGPDFVMTMVGSDAIDLTLQGGVRRLQQERTASGVKYADGAVSVWNKGREAVLELGGQTYQCVENRARSIQEDVRARGVKFRATGNEPGWVLEIHHDRIVFLGQETTERVSVPRRGAATDPSGTARTYTAVTAAHRLRVRIEDRACLDSMSGERFSARVEIELDGRRYWGCGSATGRRDPSGS